MKWVSLCLIAFILGSGFAMADEKLFVEELKCVKCHSVTSKEIPTTSKKDPSEISDLSETGKKNDAEWLTKYLKKEIEKDGKKHKMKFKGDEAQLKAMVAWLSSLKG